MKYMISAACRAVCIWAAAVLFLTAAGCGSTELASDVSDTENNMPKDFTGSFSGYDWIVASGTAGIVSGRLIIDNPDEGIALMLEPDSAAQAVQNFGGQFYIEAIIRPTAKGSGKDKNFGITSHIGKTSSGQDNFYYAGINWNGRNQLGTQITPKGLQFGSLISDTSVWTNVVSPQPYVIRYEYDGGRISGSINGIPFNKSGKTAYDIKDTEKVENGSFGIYTNGDSFELYSFKIGSLDTGKSALKMSCSGGDFITLKENSSAFVLLNENNWNVRMGTVPADIQVEAFDSAGLACGFSAVSSGSAVSVLKTESGFTMTPAETGSAAVTVTNESDPSVKKIFYCSVSKGLKLTDTDYEDYSAFYPLPGSAGVFEDEILSIRFDTVPVLTEDAVYIYSAADDSLADTIRIGSENHEIPDGTGNTTAYTLKNFMIQTVGNTVYIKPHYGALVNGSSYYAVIPDGAIDGTVNGKPFTGFDGINRRWSFTVRPVHTPAAAGQLTIGSSAKADFRTVQAGLTAAEDRAVIRLEPGTYREIINYKSGKSITIEGPSGSDRGSGCEIVGINCNSYNGGTHGRAVFYWSGSDLTLKNVTIRNAYDRNTDGTAQSEALFFANGTGKKLTAYNCSFKGFQDTIQTTGKNWFYRCYIEGDTDFIWGSAEVALFEECDIVMLDTSKDAVPSSASYIFETRVGNLANPVVPKGYVLFNCRIRATHGGGNWFGRRATAKESDTDYYDQAAVINTTVTGTIQSPLWSVGNLPEYIAKDSEGNMNVGWKVYGGSGFVPADSQPYAGIISEQIYEAEYSSRDVIMNRVFNISAGTYQPAVSVWKLDPEVLK